MFEPISFSECKNLTDDTCVVFMGVLFEYTEDELESVDDFFHQIGLIDKYSHVRDLRRIEDNVLGDEGRTDVVICFDSCNPNPMARLRYGKDIKWVSDFVVNYENDYFSE